MYGSRTATVFCCQVTEDTCRALHGLYCFEGGQCHPGGPSTHFLLGPSPDHPARRSSMRGNSRGVPPLSRRVSGADPYRRSALLENDFIPPTLDDEWRRDRPPVALCLPRSGREGKRGPLAPTSYALSNCDESHCPPDLLDAEGGFKGGRGLPRSQSLEEPPSTAGAPRVSMTPPSSIGRRRKAQAEGSSGLASAGLLSPPSARDWLDDSRGQSPDLPVFHYHKANLMQSGGARDGGGDRPDFMTTRLALISQLQQGHDVSQPMGNQASHALNVG